MSGMPSILYHKVRAFNPELVVRAMASIKKIGLVPQKPSEYKESLPAELREVPLVWLAGKMVNPEGTVLKVQVGRLDLSKLFKLGWDDVDWWVYQGRIPATLLKEIE